MDSRIPPWARKKYSLGDLAAVKAELRDLRLHTVCESARCPNIGECFKKPTATFMILGDVCTRRCKFGAVIRTLREQYPELMVEVLTPDFKGDETALKTVIDARPHIFNHNLETVPRLYAKVRPQAVYQRSLT